MNTVQPPRFGRFAPPIWLTAIAPIFALVLCLAVLAAAVLARVAQHEDEAVRTLTQRLVASAVAGRAQATTDLVRDYANWDDAHQAISGRWNAAWLSENYYSSVLDAVIVFRNGQMRFLWTTESLRRSRGAAARDALAVARDLPGLERLASAPSTADTAALALMTLDGKLALIAVAPVTPEDNATRLAQAREGRPQDFVLGVQVLEESDIAALGQALGLHEFRFAGEPAALEEGESSWPITELNGQGPAAFVWRDERPGSAGFWGRLWPIFLVLLALGALAAWASHALTLRLIRRAAAAE